MNIKIEYKYIQSNIFIVSATYLFKSFYRITLQTKRLASGYEMNNFLRLALKCKT